MLVNDLMTKDVECCSPTDTLNDVAYKMWQRDCGAMPVCDQERVVIGMITDRDMCMRACFTNLPMSQLTVAEAMSDNVRSSRTGEDVALAENVMQESQLHRLPVTDDAGHLLGIISLADLAREAARQLESGQTELTESEVGRTLSAVTEPRKGDSRWAA